MIPPLADIVCAYAGPYCAHEEPFASAMQHYLHNNKLLIQVPEPTPVVPALAPTPTSESAAATCCAQAPDCNCSRNRKKICNRCVIS